MSEEKALEQLLREARRDLVPQGRGADDDWSDVDRALFDRLDADEASAPAVPSIAAERSARGWWVVGAFAAAAAAAVFLRPASPHATFEGTESVAMAPPHIAASILSRSGAGELRLGGAPANEGRPLAVGDRVETDATHVVFDSTWGAGHEVAWAIDEESVLDVRRVPVNARGQGEGPFILGLERGAIEAQVSPVPRGEAFAVDVGPMRVAVHGTHLRVARAGAQVTVDLTEGVVSVGEPPRVGSTYGTLVTAPAHVTFDLDDPTHAVHVDRSATAVRPAADLSAAPQPVAVGERATPVIPPEPEAPVAPVLHKAERGAEGPGNVAAPVPSSAVPGRLADPHADATVRQAVTRCTEPLLHGADVRVTVTSTLTLRVGADGLVTFAQFDPPLAPSAQTCAATTIYRTRFASTGTVSIPIRIDE